MVRVNYTGFGDAKTAFETLRPMHQKLRAMQDRLRPFGPDYLVLDAAIKALTTAAFHFTGDPTFYGLKLERSTTVSSPPGSSF
jgi:hypothetical protein